MIQVKYNGKSVINYLKEECLVTLFFLIENDTCDTFNQRREETNKETSERLRLVLFVSLSSTSHKGKH